MFLGALLGLTGPVGRGGGGTQFWLVFGPWGVTAPLQTQFLHLEGDRGP